MAEPIKMSFAIGTQVGQSKHVLRGGAHWRHLLHITAPSMYGAMRPFVKLRWRLVLDVLGSGYVWFSNVIRGESLRLASVSSLDFGRAALVNIASSPLDEHISDPKRARTENFAQKPLNIRKWYPTTCAATPLCPCFLALSIVYTATAALALVHNEDEPLQRDRATLHVSLRAFC